jgi:hypothetical protein
MEKLREGKYNVFFHPHKADDYKVAIEWGQTEAQCGLYLVAGGATVTGGFLKFEFNN